MAKMARFFFHIRQGDDEITDDDGLEFPTIAHALAHARVITYEVTANATPGEYVDATVVVFDAQENEIAKIPFE
jgi:hypothetical protein